MRLSWLLALFAIGIAADQDQEIPCENFLYSSIGYYYVKEIAYEILGAVDAVNSLDLRRTNVVLNLFNLKWNHGRLGDEIHRQAFRYFREYKYALGEIREPYWDEELEQNVEPSLPSGFEGTLEEMIKYQAKEEEKKVKKHPQSYTYESLKQDLEQEQGRTDFKSYMPDFLTNENLRAKMKEMLTDQFKRPWSLFGFFHWLKDGVVWKEWQNTLELRLLKRLENLAFFQPEEDNPLNGGYDILTFLLMNPRVFKSPKIKPLLKVTLIREILMKPNIDEIFFRCIECILADNAKPSMYKTIGLDRKTLLNNFQSLKKSYRDQNVTKQEEWVDLAVAAFEDLEEIDVDEIFAGLYITTWKLYMYISDLDLENGLFIKGLKLRHVLYKTHLELIAEEQDVYLNVVKALQTPAFWWEMESIFRAVHPSTWIPQCSSLQDCFKPIFPAFDGWKQFPSPEEALVSQDGKFKATTFFENYRKENKMSLFQLKFGGFNSDFFDGIGKKMHRLLNVLFAKTSDFMKKDPNISAKGKEIIKNAVSEIDRILDYQYYN